MNEIPGITWNSVVLSNFVASRLCKRYLTGESGGGWAWGPERSLYTSGLQED